MYNTYYATDAFLYYNLLVDGTAGLRSTKASYDVQLTAPAVYRLYLQNEAECTCIDPTYYLLC